MEQKPEKRIPITNRGATAKFVNGVMIPPGGTKHFFARELPGHLLPPAAPAAAPAPAAEPDPDAARQAQQAHEDAIQAAREADAAAEAQRLQEDEKARAAAEASALVLTELLAGATAAETIAKLEYLTDEDLGKLEVAEQGRKDDADPRTQPRKTVLEAIGAEQLKRAGAPD